MIPLARNRSTRRRRQVGPVVIATDDFNRTPGDTISVGYPWTLVSGPAWLISNAGRARAGVAGTSLYARTVTGGYPDDYEVSWDVFRAGSNTDAIGVAGRVAGSNYYHARYHNSVIGWQLYRFSPGATLLGSWSDLIGEGGTKRGTLRMVGNAISLLVNGVERISVTDSTLTAGIAGMRGALDIGGDASGLHIDNWRVTTIS